jgi:predicted nucleic acid-binding Zn ribbon protein
MPLYTYRRADGTTFDIKQKFTDDPLTVDPQSGQAVVRVVQGVGIIFKGSGFYVNDSKSKSSSTMNSTSHSDKSNDSNGSSSTDKADSSKPSETKAETKTESKAESKPEAKTKSTSSAAAD